MKEKRRLFKAPEPGQAGLGITPEALYPVNMASFIGKFILTMVDPEMLLVADVHEPVVASPAVRMDNTFQADAAANDGLEGRPAAIRHDLGIYSPLALKDAENNRFTARSAPSQAFDSSRAEVALVNLDLPQDRRLLLAELGHPPAKSHEVAVYGVPVETGDLGDLGSVQINGKELDQLTEFGLRNFRTMGVLVNRCHDSVLAG